jgi:hypothetical protein
MPEGFRMATMNRSSFAPQGPLALVERWARLLAIAPSQYGMDHCEIQENRWDGLNSDPRTVRGRRL